MFKKIYLIFLSLFSFISLYLCLNMGVIPNLYLSLIIIIYLIILLLSLFLITRNNKVIKGIGIFISIIILILNISITFISYKFNNFFDKITNISYETSNYLIIVLKDSKYDKIDDLPEIGIIKNNIDKNYNKAIEKLNNDYKVNYQEYDNILKLVNDFLNNSLSSILINENYLEIINEANDNFKDNIKIIDTISIETINEDKNEIIDLNKINSFNIYISGIDTYGDISTVSRSDVNIIATVNLKDSKILLTNTPRDYYVSLAGTDGSKDKLTHAGTYGINTSIKTLENLYDTNIDYYIRVNFNSLISIVDSIGGIDIYSDQSLVTLNNKTYITEGWNHLDGYAALGYSRERYSYMDGDRHRGKNQQQVIEAIIKKVTSSNDLNNYLKLLNTLENSFQTNIDKKLINDFINLQIKNKYNWNIESISVTGYDSANYTYSYPGELLYVMEPDIESLEIAKTKIEETLNTK